MPMKKLSVRKSTAETTSTSLAQLVNDDFINTEKTDSEDEKSSKTGAQSQLMSNKTSWIYRKFRKRSCRRFIRSNTRQDRCHCGRLEEQHKSEALKFSENDDLQAGWEVSQHTVVEPTDAYGELEFQGAGPASRAKYIRIAHDTDPELVLRLLQREWNLELPKLLISVTGGAKNFVLHPKLKQVLRQGLLKAAKTTGAWIFTGGTNTGVMRHVGEAVRGHSVTSRRGYSNSSHQVRLIGIATWGIVNHREVLIGNENLVCYPMSSSMVSQGACLDNNHSHFILVDDGTVEKYGGEITLRACLENCISNKKISRNKDHGVPVVLLVLEGGPNTIRTVLESVTRNPAVPVVIAEGSGRAADVLAYAHKFVAQTDNSEFNELADVVEHRHLLFKIEKAFPECNDESCIQIYENVLKCVSNKRYITVFSVNEGGVDIDRAILRALLRGQNASAADQLSLALIWNREDIAKSEIFTEDQKWDVRDLEPIMKDALINNRVEFVKLLLENGVAMSKFLTARRLEDLYQARLKYSVTLRHLLGEQKRHNDFRLADLPSVFQRLLRINVKADPCDGYGSIRKGLGITNFELFNNSRQDGSYLPHPFNDLLIWAVLTNMQSMALFMWERDDESMAKALVAGRLYKAMARELARDEMKAEICDKLQENAREFLQLALGLLNECFQTNEELAQQLLTYNLENWGSQTCLALAVATEHEEFVAHTCCQKLLTEIWVGAMRIGNWASLQTVLGILFPPFIFSLEFKNSRQLSYMPVTYEEFIHNRELVEEDGELTDGQPVGTARFAKQSVEGDGDGDDGANVVFRPPTRCSSSESLGLNNRISTNLKCDIAERGKTLGLGRCLYEFYRAPITKFWGNVIVYLLFLVLFSFVILVRLEAKPSVPEWVLIVFVFTLCIEEVRQILQWEHSSFLLKLKEWASNNWNICDGVAVVMFFVAVALRMHPSTLSAGHVIYCLDAMVWIIRLLDIFSVSKNLGPYVVMIGRMTVDMGYFLLIMVVFLVAYGVAQQALLFPNSSPSWTLLSGILYRPYFQIYGELFFDEEGGDVNTTFFRTPKYDNHGSPIVLAIMAFYLLVANILLLNLLIAIFNNTFSAVQENSEQIWKYNRYHLIMEYASRPLLVPPFIILNHVYLLYQACQRGSRCCGDKNCSSTHDGRLKRFLNREERDKLMLFEEQCADVYMSNRDTLFHATHEERIRALGSRVACLSAQLQEMNKEVMSKQENLSKATRALDCRSARVEEYTVQILDVLENMQPLVPALSDQADETVADTCPNTALPQTGANDSRSSPWVFPAPGSGSVKPYRMMSVPAHVHQRQMSRQLSQHLTECSEAPSYPAYFRRKFPHVRTQSVEPKANGTRRGSIIKAVERFRRHTTSDVLDDLPVHDISDVTVTESSTDDPQKEGGNQPSFDAVTRLRKRGASDPVESGVDSVGQMLRNQRSMTVTLPTHPKLPLESSSCPKDAYEKARNLGLHVRARQSPYPKCTKQRYPVPDFLVDWQMPFPGYCPPAHTDETVLAEPDWADLDIIDPAHQDIRLNFNDLDGPVDRRCYVGQYDVIDRLPRNPKGRTGMCGRGLLGRWGPNHAADPIVTRWKMTSEGEVLMRLGKPVLEFVAIERKDNKEWALPGGMVETGDTVSKTLKKEFSEEALCSQDASFEERERISEQLEAFFSRGLKVYVGYVDDPRNTDNAWIETTALNFHDENGETLRSVELKAGDDACGVEWQEVSGNIRLYTNHSYMLRRVAEMHNAYF